MQLRPYQEELVARVSAAFKEGAASVVMQLGTGGGKTATASELLGRATARGYPSVFIAHLDSLVGDTHERLVKANVPCGFVQAGRPSDPEAPVQVCSTDTLRVRGLRPPAKLVVVDECHRAMSESVSAILAAYPEAAILGLTATPQRGDGRPLGDRFERLICGPSNKWLTSNGFLVPCDLLAPGDFKEGKLAMDPVDAYEAYTPGQRGIVFASNKEHARTIARDFNARGITAATLVGETPRERRLELRAQLASGELKILVGVGVFLEGWDCPEVEVVILARALGVCGAFLQAIGRGLRPAHWSGKTRCTVIDLRGAVYVHGLPDEDRIWSIDGHAVRRAEKITALMRCRECLAVFRPCAHCPRCGAVMKGAPRIPRVLTRPERLASFSDLPQVVRDYRYLEQLERVARQRMRKSDIEAAQWALVQFKKRFGREPERGAAA